MHVTGYVELEFACRGGSSAVFRARQVATDRVVALKVLDGPVTERAARAQFARECAAARLIGDHPDIVTVYGSGFTDDGRPFLAMQWCEGGSLAGLLRESGPIPVPRALRIGVAVSAALAHAHASGVLHRDVKPGNILLTRFGDPLLADFGIAALAGWSLSTRTASSFTLAHAAPECLAGHPSTRASDVYSLASTLYTLLCGHPPFSVPPSADPIALALTAVDSPVPRLDGPTIPDDLAALLQTGMAKQPDRRPIDATVFGHELQRIQAERGLPVTRWTTAPEFDLWAQPVTPLDDDRRAARTPVARPTAAGSARPAAAAALSPSPGRSAAVRRPQRRAAVGTVEPRHGRAARAGMARRIAPPDPIAALPTDPLPAGGGWTATRRARRAGGWLVAATLVVLVIAGVGLVVYRLAAGEETAAPPGGPPLAEAAEPSAGGLRAPLAEHAAAVTAAVDPPVITALGGPPGGHTVACPSPRAVVSLGLTWRSRNARTAWLAVDAGPDASTHPLRAALPSTVGPGNPQDPVELVPFDCSASRHTYTLTVFGPGGTVSSSLVYTTRRLPGSAPAAPAAVRGPAAGPTTGRADPTTGTGTRRTTSPTVTTPGTPTSGAPQSGSPGRSPTDAAGNATLGASPTTGAPATSSPAGSAPTTGSGPATGPASTPPTGSSTPDPISTPPPTTASTAGPTTSAPPAPTGTGGP